VAAPVLTIGAVNQTAKILNNTFRYSLNSLDVTLYDPATIPAVGNAVTSTNPTWAGAVASVKIRDNGKTGHKFVTITATNTDEAIANPAPFDLRDVDGDFRNLEVTTTLHNGVTEIRGTLETFLAGLDPGDVFELTSATHGYTAEEFSIREISVGWLKSTGSTTPLFRIAFGDPIVTLSAWVEEDSGILPITETKITDGAVSTPKLAAGSVTSDQIEAGSISADKLAATLVLASLLQTAETGNRVEMDADGFRVYSADEDLLVNMPTDGSPIFINAELVASSLSVVGDATLSSDGNTMGQASVLTLDSYQSDPTQAPSLAQGWATATMPYDATYDYAAGNMRRYSLSYDAAGGAGGTTKVFWTMISAAGGVHYLAELLASNRTVNRAIEVLSTYNPGYDQVSCVRHGSYVYVLYQDHVTFQWTVKRYTASSLTLDFTYNGIDMPVIATQSPVIGSDGTNLFIADKGSGSETIRWNKYNSGMEKQGSTINTSYNSGNDDHVRGIFCGSADFGAARIVIATEKFGTAHSFTTTGTHQTDECFPVKPSTVGLTYGDALADGARFWSIESFVGAASYSLVKHSTWTWTTASSKYWVAYSWADSHATGGTHETEVGPMASITMGRRKQLTITGVAIPFGGTDDPNNRKIYMVPNASQPATTALKLQSTVPTISTTLSTYNSGGAAPPTSNSFSSVAAPAEIRSAAGEWSLMGDGKIRLAGRDAWLPASIGGFTKENPSASLTDAAMGRFHSDNTASYIRAPIANRAGRIVAVGWRCSTAITAGSMTIKPQVGGTSVTGPVLTSADGTSGTHILASPLAFAVNSGIGVLFTTSGTYAPTTNDWAVELLVEYEPLP